MSDLQDQDEWDGFDGFEGFGDRGRSRHLTGSVNGGGKLLRLRTARGNIQIRER